MRTINLSAMVLLCVMQVACISAPGSHISGVGNNNDKGLFRDIFNNPIARGNDSSDVRINGYLINHILPGSPPSSSTANRRIHNSSQHRGKLDSKAYAYAIGNGDVLSIVVWDHPELTAPFGSFNDVAEQGNVVREDGTIYYPFVGSVQAAGRTALEIRDELAEKLAEFIESPQLDVRVAKYRSQRFLWRGLFLTQGHSRSRIFH